MTAMRDARLHKALQDAPDGDARPAAATRDAILARAHAAVAKTPTVPRWKRWLGAGDAGVHMPWNAALATVALATLVTVLWHGKEVPDASVVGDEPAAGRASIASPEVKADAVARAKEAAVPVAKDSALAQSPPAPGKAPPVAPARQSEARPSHPPAPAKAPAVAANPAAVPEPPIPAETRRDRAEAEQGPRAADAVAPQEPLAKALPPPAAAQVAPPPPAAPSPAPPPPPAAAGVSAYASPASRPTARLSMQFQPAPDALLRIEVGDRKADIASADAQRLAEMLSRASLEARTVEALDAPVDATIDVVRDGRLVQRIELAGAQVRVTPGVGRVRTGRPDPALLRELREEIARALR